MAIAIVIASEQVKEDLDDSSILVGELGLDGSVRTVRGIIGKLLAGRERSIKTFYIPAGNLPKPFL